MLIELARGITNPTRMLAVGDVRPVAAVVLTLRWDQRSESDIDDEKYIAIPDKIELDLGKPLVLGFAREFLPDDYGEVCQIFSRSGAYRRYKDLLMRRGALERVLTDERLTEKCKSSY
jgi:hypothetical protein